MQFQETGTNYVIIKKNHVSSLFNISNILKYLQEVYQSYAYLGPFSWPPKLIF